MKFLKYINNNFLLFIPILIFNILFFKKLPSHYLKNISHPIIVIETITRIITIVFSIIMTITIQNKIGKIGLTIYIIGIIIYFISYFIEIIFSNTILGRNIIVILSPYWTSIIWLIGIGLLGNRLFVNIPYHFTVYLILSIIFTIVHTIHGYLCYKM
jgi:hypothetical protein